jgi:hypothetical protein
VGPAALPRLGVCVLELHYNKAAAVSFADTSDAVVPTTATLTLRKADDSVLQTPNVTLPTVSTTTAAGTTAQALELASATGVTVGDPYRLDMYGQVHVVYVDKLDGTTATLREALPEAPPNGSTFKGLKMTATLTADGTPRANAMLRWEYDDGATYKQAQQVVDLVRWPFGDVIKAPDVAERLATMGSSESDVWCERVAGLANARIRAYLRSGGRRPDLIADRGAFETAGGYAMDLVLAERGVFASAEDPLDTRERLRDAFSAEMNLVLSGCTYYDSDDDGDLSPSERPTMGTSRIIR